MLTPLWRSALSCRPKVNRELGFPLARTVGPGPATTAYPLCPEDDPSARRDPCLSLWNTLAMEEAPSLRILVTDGIGEQLEVITRTVVGLGHEVIARESSLPEVARLTATERPDVALVIVSQGTIHALEMIDQIVHEAACPVIAILHAQDRGFIMEAAKRGIFAYVVDGGDPEELQSAIDVVLKRFAEYHNLEGAFGRRAVTERAKGILMERHGVDEEAAFNLLRDHARRKQAKLVDIAEAVVAGQPLLPAKRQSPE
jgi:AmiR/NasT family two-component response regulator